jgi:hypothetical protein
MPWQKGAPAVSSPKEIGMLFMDPRGRRGPYKAQNYVVQVTDPRPSGHRGTPPALRRRNDTSGQHGLSCQEGKGSTYLARSEVSLIRQ